MPILKNAKKALRASKKKADVNRRTRSRMRTMMAKMFKQPSAEILSSAFSAVDRAAKKNLIHKNKAARYKSQMSAALQKAAQ